MNIRTSVLLLAVVGGGAYVSPGHAAPELVDTSWRLVKIMSMDDRVYVPEDTAKYTLTLSAEGTAAIRADCNRGTATWTVQTPGQLQFGPVATTRALCPPGSLSEKYLTQFKWVRSYVMKNGHLFLATMADGSIVEFEPAGDTRKVAATVLGDDINAADIAQLRGTILTRLLDQYAEEHGIAAKDAEIDAFVVNMQRGMREKGLTAEQDLTSGEAAEADAMRRAMGRAIIRQWKINKALYDQYSGRIIYQQLGPEPLDAYREFLEQRQDEGAFTIHDQAMTEGFWRYFTDESIHDFMQPGSKDEARAFAVPPWNNRP